MTQTGEIWLMLAFPGDDIGRYALRAFAPSKSGKCWFRRLPTREAAIRCKAELVEAGIRFVCKKVPANTAPRRAVTTPNFEAALRHPHNTPSVSRRDGKRIQDSYRDLEEPAGRFGGLLNARNINGNWRRKGRRP